MLLYQELPTCCCFICRSPMSAFILVFFETAFWEFSRCFQFGQISYPITNNFCHLFLQQFSLSIKRLWSIHLQTLQTSVRMSVENCRKCSNVRFCDYLWLGHVQNQYDADLDCTNEFDQIKISSISRRKLVDKPKVSHCRQTSNYL